MRGFRRSKHGLVFACGSHEGRTNKEQCVTCMGFLTSFVSPLNDTMCRQFSILGNNSHVVQRQREFFLEDGFLHLSTSLVTVYNHSLVFEYNQTCRVYIVGLFIQ